MGYLQKVGVLLAQQVLKEGVDVHGAHPSLLIVSRAQED
jgi:Rad3-related DNA helicase